MKVRHPTRITHQGGQDDLAFVNSLSVEKAPSEIIFDNGGLIMDRQNHFIDQLRSIALIHQRIN